jgi:hypothetical protein
MQSQASMASRRRFLWFLVAAPLVSMPAVAQPVEIRENGQKAAPVDTMTREEWRAHILDVRRRVQEENARRRLMPRQPVHLTAEEIEKIATERVLGDGSLRFGDIVVTNRGRFVFRGTSESDPKPEDFVKLADQ